MALPKKYQIILPIVVVLILILAYAFYPKKGGLTEKQGENKPASGAALPAEVVILKTDTLSNEVQTVGTILPNEAVLI